MNAPGKSFLEMMRELKDQVYLEPVDWWHQTWRSWPFSFDEPSYVSPGIIIMDSNLSNLVSSLHKVSLHKRFDVLVQSWESIAPLSSKELEELTKAKKLKQYKARKGQ